MRLIIRFVWAINISKIQDFFGLKIGLDFLVTINMKISYLVLYDLRQSLQFLKFRDSGLDGIFFNRIGGSKKILTNVLRWVIVDVQIS